jgi:hypothetical protein
MTLHRILVTSLLLAAPAASVAQTTTHIEAEQASLRGLKATVYKSPTCGCCEGYIAFLRKHGVTVEVVSDDAALYEAKEANGVPFEAQSCHTVLLDGYVVEGHVPLAALTKLLSERPDIDGISMPGMPSGTPGMEGPRFGPLEVVGFKDGSVSPFVSL